MIQPMSVAAFTAQRPLLFSIAYRMLGSAAEAEDVLQEAWLRWQFAPSDLSSEKAWLSRVVVNLCLDQLKSARVQREKYIGPWLPEPVKEREPIDTQSISLAFLVLLEALSPVERAVYLLHEVFDYSFGEIATIVDKEEATCRQLHHRAQQHVVDGRPRFAPSREKHQALLATFMYALASGDIDNMKSLLAKDATFYSDGGGKVNAARNPIFGAEKIIRFLMGVLKKQYMSSLTHDVEIINGNPAIVTRQNGEVYQVLDIETDGERIFAFRAVLNPDKLQRV
jgi:RNA polymerase sigma-70 factor (ECF subfamily)